MDSNAWDRIIPVEMLCVNNLVIVIK